MANEQAGVSWKDVNNNTDDLAVISVKPREIRLPRGLKLSIAVMAVLDLIGNGLKEDVTAALKAQGFK